MGQTEIFAILSKNPGIFISAKELSQLTNTKIQTIWANIRALEKDSEFQTRELKGTTNHSTKFIAFVPHDPIFEKVFSDFTKLKQDKRFVFAQSDYLQNFILISEIRKLREEIANGK